MKTPAFWYNTAAPVPAYARLGARVYAAARAWHVAHTTPILSPLPTLCIGNVTAGGAGKTPVVAALYNLLRDQSPCVLMRGFGGKIHSPTYVMYKHTPSDVGDEAVMMTAAGIHVVVAKDRRAGAEFIAQKKTARLILLDDGLQNRSLSAHKNILVIDGAVGFGNGHLIPAGPLREPLPLLWPRIHAVMMIGDDQTDARAHIPGSIPVYTARPTYDTTHLDMTARYIAFAGIGRPDKFYNALRDHHIHVHATRDFPDHHVYTPSDLDSLITWAEREGARLITTQKDMVKIPQDQRAHFDVLPMTMTFDQPDDLRAFLLT